MATNSDDLADGVRRLRQYGWGRKYEVTMLAGRNSRLDELQASLLLTRLPHLDRWNARRRTIVQSYAEAIAPNVGRFVARPSDDYVAHLAVIVAEDRERLRAKLDAAGVGTDVHYPVADHRQQAWRDDYPDVALPVTEHAVEHVLTVPCFPELSDEEVERVCEALNEL